MTGEFATEALGEGGGDESGWRGACEACGGAEICDQFLVVVGDGFGFDADGVLGFGVHIKDNKQ